MSKHQKSMYSVIIMVSIVVVSALMFSFCGKSADSQDNVVIGYVFAENNLIKPEQIEAEKLTHINYAFADIENDTIKMGYEKDEENFKLLNSLKERNPDLKILISVGGWTWSDDFSDMALTEKSRKKFVKSAVEFVRKYNLDGIDLDWEYPGLPGIGNKHRPEDKKNFNLLLKELREELDKYEKIDNKEYLSTIAAGAFDKYIEATDMGEAAKYLDFVNLMTYDFYGATVDSIASHHTCLYDHPKAPKNRSTHHAVEIFHEAGVPKNKIVIGAAFFGKSWGNVKNKNNGLFQLGDTVRINASYKNIRTKLEGNKGYQRYWDETSKAPYLYSDSTNIFITYDDTNSVKLKCDYIKDNNLRGIMFWEYHGDYQNELLNTMSGSLLNN